MLKAVFFDLDGTLVNSLCDLFNAVNYALEFYGYQKRDYVEFKSLVGNGNRYMIENALPEHSRDGEEIQKTLNKFFEYYESHCADKTRQYDGISDLLKYLKEKGIKTAVITNKAQAMTEAVLSSLFKDGTFDAVYGQREGIPVKPDPSLCILAAGELGVLNSECLFVGDSANDINVAKNFACKSVGVLWGFREKEELATAGADYIVSKPSEIADIIKSIDKGKEN